MLTRNQQKLIYWIHERDSIRKKKEAGDPKPWSQDSIFQNVRFCNVNREDDKVTKWIRQNWTYPVAKFGDNEGSRTDLLYDVAMIAARIFNLPSTLEAICQPVGDISDSCWWLEHIEEQLFELKDSDKRIWNGAYIISTNGVKIGKIEYCLNLLRKICEEPYITSDCSTLAEAHKKLSEIKGLGSFLSAQVVADLKNTEGHPLRKAKDWYSFSSHGPGSLRGLSWFFERKISPGEYQSAIKTAFEMIEFDIENEILDFLCMQNFQNCFCEYDKYMRVFTGSGRAKQKYKGE